MYMIHEIIEASRTDPTRIPHQIPWKIFSIVSVRAVIKKAEIN